MAVAMAQMSWTWFQTSPYILAPDKALGDVVLGIPCLNMVPGDIEYFKLEESEKQAAVGRTL